MNAEQLAMEKCKVDWGFIIHPGGTAPEPHPKHCPCQGTGLRYHKLSVECKGRRGKNGRILLGNHEYCECQGTERIPLEGAERVVALLKVWDKIVAREWYIWREPREGYCIFVPNWRKFEWRDTLQDALAEAIGKGETP